MEARRSRVGEKGRKSKAGGGGGGVREEEEALVFKTTMAQSMTTRLDFFFKVLTVTLT